jgi:general secretion pathway protein E
MTNTQLDIINFIKKNRIVNEEKVNEIKMRIDEGEALSDILLNEVFFDEESMFIFVGELLKKNIIKISDISENFPVDLEKVLTSFAESINAIYLDLDTVDINYKLASKVPLSQLRRYFTLPLYDDEISIYIAFGEPYNIKAQEALQRYYPKKLIKIVVTDPLQIEKYFNKLEISSGTKDLISEIRKELTTSAAENPGESSGIMKLIESIIKTAILYRGSDIHIEPTENNCIVRTRVDGMLVESFVFEKDIYPPLSSRIKLLSNLDIAERRKPQDGRFSLKVMDKEYDFRVSTLPITNGESIVMRILDKSKVMIKLESLGMSEVTFEKFNKAMRVPYGIVFVTGPTGSGKTTTLYAALNAIKNITTKIITVEDPVEYQLNLTQQVQVNEKANLTFASALKSILRQDPDVIMIGEVRDQETLRIAIQAALTGHMVFSTLHTNDAISAVNRVLDMGIEPYLVSGALIAIEAQRLIRKLCPHCKSKVTLPKKTIEEFESFLPENYQFYKAVGCDKCANSGYFGREMISEILVVSEEIQSIIARGGSKSEIEEQAKKDNFVNMLQDGIIRAANGITSIEEVYRVVKS